MRKIRNKLMLTMMVLTLLPAVLIGAYSIYTTSEALRENALIEQRNQLTQIQNAVEHHVSGVEKDLLFLRDSSALQLYLSAKRASTSRSRLLLENLSNSAVLFIQQQQTYAALRLLDKDGKELLRVENVDGQATNLSDKKQLRDLKERDFFKQAVALKRGQIYISPIELRRDTDSIITPHQPTLRYATPVTDKGGSVQAVLVLNLDGKQLIEQVTTRSDETWNVLFTDPNGYFLYHADKEKRWGGPKDLNNSHNAFEDQNLSLASLEGSEEATSFENDEQLTLSQPISLGEGRPSLGYLFSTAPKKALFKPEHDYFTVTLIIAAISLLLSLVFALIQSNSLSEPLVSLTKQVERFSRGDLDTPIQTSEKNEIGELSHAIELLRKSMNILMKRTRKV